MKAVVEKAPDFRQDPYLNAATRKYLEVLNSGGVPVEDLSKEDARNVLKTVQASVKVDVSGIDETEKMISADGHHIKLNVVRPNIIQCSSLIKL